VPAIAFVLILRKRLEFLELAATAAALAVRHGIFPHLTWMSRRLEILDRRDKDLNAVFSRSKSRIASEAQYGADFPTGMIVIHLRCRLNPTQRTQAMLRFLQAFCFGGSNSVASTQVVMTGSSIEALTAFAISRVIALLAV
jgi:hypothetical protein